MVGSGAWWAAPWPPGFLPGPAPSMTYLELVPLLVACLVWGDHWRGRRVRVICDNMGVVGCVSRGWSGDARTMALLRHLLFAAALRDCTLEALFVPTKGPPTLSAAATSAGSGVSARRRRRRRMLYRPA